MNDTMIDGLTQVIMSLKPAQRRRLLTRLVDGHVLSEDDEDRLLLELRGDEPSVSYRNVRKKLIGKGAVK